MRGNRRQTNQNRLKNIIIEFIKENIKTYLILTIIFFIGLTLGVIFVNNANETQANQISGYINNFINSIKENYQISTKELLKNSIINNVGIAVLLWFLGSTVIGFPLIYMEDRRRENIKLQILKHTIFSILMLILLLISSLLETYVSGNLSSIFLKYC